MNLVDCIKGAELVVTLPVYKKEKGLTDAVLSLWRFFSDNLWPSCKSLIVVNESTYGTCKMAQTLAHKRSNVDWAWSEEKWRGRAVKKV